MRTISIDAIALRVDDDQPTFWDRVAAGRWEPGTLAVYRDRVGPGTAVLDLGAWVGPLALYAAALGASVVAVEADPAACAGLRRNLAANPGLAARVTVVPAAVAPRPGTVRLGARRRPGDSMSSALLAAADPTRAWEAEAVTPDALAARLPADRPLFVKLDIEGGEYALLPALRPLLDRPGAALLASFHPAILREAGDPDPDATTAAALRPFAGLPAFAVGPDGAGAAQPDPVAVGRADTWLWTAA